MKSSQNSSSLIITHRLLKSRGDLPILLQRNTKGKITLGLSRMIPKKPSASNWTSKKTCFGRSLGSTSVTLNKPCYAVSPPEEGMMFKNPSLSSSVILNKVILDISDKVNKIEKRAKKSKP